MKAEAEAAAAAAAAAEAEAEAAGSVMVGGGGGGGGSGAGAAAGTAAGAGAGAAPRVTPADGAGLAGAADEAEADRAEAAAARHGAIDNLRLLAAEDEDIFEGTERVRPAARALVRLGVDVPLVKAEAAVVRAGGCPLGACGDQLRAVARWTQQRTFSEARRAAQLADVAAMQAAAECLYYGRGGATADKREARYWARRSASANVATGLNLLGILYDRGEGGLAADRAEGARLFALAARQGLDVAQFNLGCAYGAGQGVAQDFRECVRLWTLAAKQGYARARGNLALALAQGKIVEKNPYEALCWGRLAVKQGDPVGDFSLGILYENGWSVPQDKREAVKWYALGATQGHRGCIAALNNIVAEGGCTAADEAWMVLRRLGLLEDD